MRRLHCELSDSSIGVVEHIRYFPNKCRAFGLKLPRNGPNPNSGILWDRFLKERAQEVVCGNAQSRVCHCDEDLKPRQHIAHVTQMGVSRPSKPTRTQC